MPPRLDHHNQPEIKMRFQAIPKRVKDGTEMLRVDDIVTVCMNKTGSEVFEIDEKGNMFTIGSGAWTVAQIRQVTKGTGKEPNTYFLRGVPWYEAPDTNLSYTVDDFIKVAERPTTKMFRKITKTKTK